MSISTSTSMGSDGDMGMSMGMGKDAGTADSALCIGKAGGPKEHLASEGDANLTSPPEPEVLGAENMDDPLSKDIPSYSGLSLQTGVNRQRPADVKNPAGDQCISSRKDKSRRCVECRCLV